MAAKERVLLRAKPPQGLTIRRALAQVGEEFGHAPTPVEELQVRRVGHRIRRSGECGNLEANPQVSIDESGRVLIPVIILSAAHQIRLQAAALNAAAVFAKPFGLGALLNAVARLITEPA